MVALLSIRDQFFGEKAPSEEAVTKLKLDAQQVTARDIVTQRVAEEVDAVNSERWRHALNHRRNRSFLIDVEAGSVESRLNAPSAGGIHRTKLLDTDAEIAKALKAHETNRFIMFFGDRQIEDLDEVLPLEAESEVIFVHLMPLRGG